MKKIIWIPLLAGLFLSPVTASAPDSIPRISVAVTVPAGLLTREALANIQKGCGMISGGNPADAAKMFENALPGIRSPLLRKDILSAAGKISAGDTELIQKGETDGSTGLRFSHSLGKKGSGPSCFLYLLKADSQSWLAPFLKDPNWMREDLPDKIQGISAAREYLPEIRTADLVASSRPEWLSAWEPRGEGKGRILVFINLVHEYCKQYLKKDAANVLAGSWLKHVDEKALSWLVCMRRIAHGMGPLAVRTGKSSKVVAVDIALGKSHLPLEEIKADALAVLSGLRMAKKTRDFPVSSSQLVATYSAYLIARSFPASDPSTRPFRAVLLKLLSDGGLRFDLGVQKVVPDLQRMQNSLKSLLQKVIRIQDKGREDGALSFLEELKKKTNQSDFPAGLMMERPSPPELVVEMDSGDPSE